ncbi:KGK domain-containing protein [Myxosarcina sp. GI1]|uniref:KGK domain-containing protein n=1 Tax=Myxosarcina sp. GI1 TaxID=1541065 RepID=UPI00209CEAE6|nr:KGK domain-containing protein [Myxosarcina sp. GI1]
MNGDEIVSVNRDDNVLVSHHTYKVEEFLHELRHKIHGERMKKWCKTGVDCQVLTPTQGWRKGKVKIVLEFCPDETESPLDSVRQEINE